MPVKPIFKGWLSQEGNTSVYLPHAVEFSHTWVSPGILFPLRKRIPMTPGKLANTTDPGCASPAWIHTHCLCTQAHASTCSSHASLQEVLQQSSASQPRRRKRAERMGAAQGAG